MSIVEKSINDNSRNDVGYQSVCLNNINSILTQNENLTRL